MTAAQNDLNVSATDLIRMLDSVVTSQSAGMSDDALVTISAAVSRAWVAYQKEANAVHATALQLEMQRDNAQRDSRNADTARQTMQARLDEARAQASLARQYAGDQEAKVKWMTDELTQCAAERDHRGSIITNLRADLTTFKEKVVAVALAAGEEHDWCEVVDNILVHDLGLDEYMPSKKVRAQVFLRVTVEIEANSRGNVDSIQKYLASNLGDVNESGIEFSYESDVIDSIDVENVRVERAELI